MWLKPKCKEIKTAREKIGLSMHALSLKAGLGPIAVSRMEANMHKVHPLRAKALAEALGSTVDDLFEIPADKKQPDDPQQKGA
jgi:transcriptional regulator with XRE-family HTH domain